MKAVIQRLSDSGKQTIGKLTLYNGFDVVFECCTLELAWNENKQNISCIPVAEYKVKTTYSNKYKKDMYEIMNVPNRAGVRIHSGNYYTQVQGCVLVGKAFKDINSDGEVDVLQSFDTLTKLTKKAGDSFDLEIKPIT